MKATDRTRATALEDLPNVGTLIAGDLRRIGIHAPQALAGRDPYALYDMLNRVTGVRHDPCVLDTFIAAVRFMEGAPAVPWWHYTAERKATLAARAAGEGPREAGIDGKCESPQEADTPALRATPTRRGGRAARAQPR